jgi:hypothetical protein
MKTSLDEELWRRAETRREADLYQDATPEDRLLLPLVLSLARLAAQRDARTLPFGDRSACVE